VESRLIKTKIEVQFEHKFCLEVASNSIALWVEQHSNIRREVEGSNPVSLYSEPENIANKKVQKERQ
jgi:hypothetical protein